jgi:hypothetical protein
MILPKHTQGKHYVSCIVTNSFSGSSLAAAVASYCGRFHVKLDTPLKGKVSRTDVTYIVTGIRYNGNRSCLDSVTHKPASAEVIPTPTYVCIGSKAAPAQVLYKVVLLQSLECDVWYIYLTVQSMTCE